MSSATSFPHFDRVKAEFSAAFKVDVRPVEWLNLRVAYDLAMHYMQNPQAPVTERGFEALSTTALLYMHAATNMVSTNPEQERMQAAYEAFKKRADDFSLERKSAIALDRR